MTYAGPIPSRDEFRELAKRGNVIPLIVDLVADVETPVSAFAKIDNGEPCFFFESAEKNEELGRFSFVGFDPLFVFKRDADSCDPVSELQAEMARFKFVAPAKPTPFAGGAVGYIGYDVVRFFEPAVPVHPRDDLKLPEMMFMIPGSLLIFDHRFRKLRIIVNSHIGDGVPIDRAYEQAKARLAQALARLEQPIHLIAIDSEEITDLPAAESNTTRPEFEAMVRQAKELIAAGDIFQVVLSQRFQAKFEGDPLHLYRALRFGNPSPYMFCLKFDGGFAVIGSSPEMHLRVRDHMVEVRPIAGTRRRGKDLSEDEKLAGELIRDPKERAEHVMLIDLGRNDVGRVAEFGSVKVTEQMVIERYSHVMHIVSHVVGRLCEDKDTFDAVRATFPAGTVSGAPKVRAMQIIAELEKARRGFYSGIVGYFGFDGSHESCIAIRSIVLKDGNAYFQTGAGIVADSDPSREYLECINKSKAMVEAIARARKL
ncbi:MAG TPA: anthranilate synthase component I [Chthoniobacterales bacterium]|nr:anthranilate synthase component I [Chthoniobacterales bacterium]